MKIPDDIHSFFLFHSQMREKRENKIQNWRCRAEKKQTKRKNPLQPFLYMLL